METNETGYRYNFTCLLAILAFFFLVLSFILAIIKAFDFKL